MAFSTNITGNRTIGGNRPEVIIIHWWGDPAQNPTLSGVVSWFKNPASQVSAHYVVSGSDIVQMVPEADMAWHAMHMNSRSIGIEVDPNTPGVTYETVGNLVAQIRTRHGNLPLKRHRDYVTTACPGTLDVDRIEQLSKGVKGMTPYELNLLAQIAWNRPVDGSDKFVTGYTGKAVQTTLEDVLKSQENVTQRTKAANYDKQLATRDARIAELEKQLASGTGGATPLEPGIYQVK